MKISEIRVYQHDLAVADGLYQMSISQVETLDTTVVEVVTDSGLSGFGETCPLGSAYQPQFAAGARAVIAEVAPSLIGMDPRLVGLINERMDVTLNGHNYAKAAIDVACWDLMGKATGARVCDLLGGAHSTEVHGESVRSYWGIMPATPESTAAKAVELQDNGYTRLQVKTGGRPLADDVACVRAVAKVLRPGVPLTADANRGWTARDAIEFSIACRDIPLALEQPCATLEEHRQLSGRISHPVFIDESAVDVATVITAITDGIAQGFGMKLSRVGGLTKLRAVRDICEAKGIPSTIDDTWGGDLTAAATIHMGSTVKPALYEGTWISEPYAEGGYATTTPTIAPVNGRIPLPTGPGLGVEPDLEVWGPPAAAFAD